MSKKSIKIIAVFLLNLIIIFLLLSQVKINDFINNLKSIPLETIFIGLLLYLIMYFIRTARFKILLNSKEIKFWVLFNIVLVHGFYNRILPFRSGEISYIYLINKYYSVPIHMAFVSILIIRIYDLISTTIIVIVTSLILFKLLSIFFIIIIPILMWLLIFYLDYICIFVKNNLFNKFLYKFEWKFINKEMIEMRFNEIIDFSKSANSINNVIYLTILSLLLWIVLSFLFYIILLNFQVELSFLKVVFGSSLSNLTSILPVSSIGNFGTMEIGWLLGFTLIGLNKDIAIITGFSVNIFTFFAIILLGGIGLVVLRCTKEKNTKELK